MCVLFAPYQLWKAVEMGDAATTADMLRRHPSLLEAHLDAVWLYVCVYLLL